MGQISSLFSPAGSCNKPKWRDTRELSQLCPLCSFISLSSLSLTTTTSSTTPPPGPFSQPLPLLQAFCLFGILKIFADVRRLRASQPLICVNHVGKMPCFFFFSFRPCLNACRISFPLTRNWMWIMAVEAWNPYH